MTQFNITTHQESIVLAQSSQQQFYRQHLQIPSKNVAFVYPTMTLLRAPTALYGHSSVFTKRGEVFVFGGIEPKKSEDDSNPGVERKTTNTAYLYHNMFAANRIQKGHYMDMGKWTAIEDPALNGKKEEDESAEALRPADDDEVEHDKVFPSPRAFATAQYIPDSKVYVYGGEDDNKQPLNDMWCFDTAKQCWYIVGDGPVPLSLSSSVVHFETLYRGEHQAADFLKEKPTKGTDETEKIEFLDKVTNSYSSFLKDPYAQRHLPDAPNVDSAKSYHIVIYGGKSKGGKCVDSVYAYSIANKEWTQLPPGPPARRGHTSVYRDGKMYIYGGYSDVKIFNDDVWEYDIAKAMRGEEGYLRKLEPQSSRNPEGRTGQSCFLLGNQLVVFGGNTGGSINSELWMFNIDTLQWKEGKLSKTIHGRWYHSMVYANETQVMLIGGANSAMSKAIQNSELIHFSVTDIDIHPKRMQEGGDDEEEEGEGEGSDLDEYDDLLDDPELDDL